jgi:hypothetical protein
VGSVRDEFCIGLRSVFVDVSLGSAWGEFVINLGSDGDQFGMIMLAVYSQFGISLG